ncbi:MAG TPA: shikimate kinase [Paludibacteraceae bacterium]|nr:shikimate kinase [Paludibacteraceae bacterium]
MAKNCTRIFLVGFMGTGKTTFGKKLSQKIHFSFIDTDLYIENNFHKTINEIFAEKGEEGFRTIETKILAEIAEIENVVIATGGGTPCFNNNMALMNSKGLTIYLETPTPDIAQRLITGKTKRPLLKDKTSEEIVEFIEEILPKRSTYYKKADLTINVVEN